ncbi:hypothetical protein [Collimonas humicola]|uniref:hypothetical protein n=1 Tax=Collimonas humicola TaxID=2825886 RepID=UPI001B8D3FD4|nr:hypothetical protein [Collimonas humicola]
MRELTTEELMSNAVSGGFSTSTSCTDGIWGGAIGAALALPTANPVIVLGTLLAGAVAGGCFRPSGGSGDGGNNASYGGDYGGGGGNKKLRTGTVTILM